MTTFKKNEYGAYTDGHWLIYKSNHGGWIIKDMDYSCDEITREERTLKAAIAYCTRVSEADAKWRA